MKSDTSSKPLPANFPQTPEEWEKLIAAAPERVNDPDCPYDPNDAAAVEAYLSRAVLVREGGPEAVRAALAARRTRGPGKKPPKVLISLRLPADVLEAWKATGAGWQTRMAEDLSRHAPGSRRMERA